VLWAHGHRPVSVSKFAAGLSLLTPELPANRWHRVHERLAGLSRRALPESPRSLRLDTGPGSVDRLVS
jgi:hypothetical protein